MGWLEHIRFRHVIRTNHVVYYLDHKIGEMWQDKDDGQWYALATPPCLNCKRLFPLGRGFSTHIDVAEALKVCPACGETPCMELPKNDIWRY